MKQGLFAVLLVLFLPLVSFTQTDSVQTAGAFLPLRVQQLATKAVDKSIQLTWTVSANEDAKNFEVERAEDGLAFRTIGGRLALSQQGTAVYEFVDALPRKNVLFSYRIRINGRDGSTYFSELQTARVEDESLQCRLRQNPVRHTLDLEITAASPVLLLTTVLTAYGQKISSETTRLSTGLNNVSLSSQNLQAGLHRLVLEAGNERKVISFVKE